MKRVLLLESYTPKWYNVYTAWVEACLILGGFIMKEGKTVVSSNDRQLGFVQLAAVIFGSTIGSGIFTTTADMASSGANTGAIPVSYTHLRGEDLRSDFGQELS